MNKRLFHSWSFDKKNYQLFVLALIVIVIGYILMATGETTSVQSTKNISFNTNIRLLCIDTLSILYKKNKHQGVVVQLVRAPACHAGSCEFKSRLSR